MIGHSWAIFGRRQNVRGGGGANIKFGGHLIFITIASHLVKSRLLFFLKNLRGSLDVFRDAVYVGPAQRFAEIMANSSNSVYMYYFTHRPYSWNVFDSQVSFWLITECYFLDVWNWSWIVIAASFYMENSGLNFDEETTFGQCLKSPHRSIW